MDKINRLTELGENFKNLKDDFIADSDKLSNIVSAITLLLDIPYSSKIKSLEFFEWYEGSRDTLYNSESINIASALIEDQLFKWSCPKTSKQDLEILKLLKAREENTDFELELAQIICGDNQKFPYRSSYYITKFFNDLGLPYKHGNETRRFWVQEQLKKCNIQIIYNIITKGIFLLKYFKNTQWDIEDAKTEFKRFIEDSIKANETIDLSGLFNINVKNELLFNKEITTQDVTLNELVENSRSLFVKGDKQLALEKLWDAFERLKTYLGAQKRTSADELCSLLSKELEKSFYDNEFKVLTCIGNDYQIRHFEKEKKSITDAPTKEYLYFRMLSLIDLSVSKLIEIDEKSLIL